METINKNHSEITTNRRVGMLPYAQIYHKYLYFSAIAAMDYGIVPGLFMHFQNDGDRWYFYCNTDNDGFKIVGRPGRSHATVNDVSLTRLMIKRTLVSWEAKFLVAPTKTKLNGALLIEICFNKPLEICEEGVHQHDE